MEDKQFPFKCVIQKMHPSLAISVLSFCPWLQGRLGNVVERCTFVSPAKTKRKGNGHLAAMTTMTVLSTVCMCLHFLNHFPVSGSLDL